MEPSVSVVYSPQQTIFLQLRDGARRLFNRDYAGGWRLPDPVVRADRHGVLKTLAGAGRGIVPDAMVPILADRDVGADEHFAALLDFPPDQFQAQVLAAGSPDWRNAADRPRLWLQTYAAICRIAWEYLQPRWDAARPLLDRAAEQVGVASVRGGLDTVLDSLSPRIHYRDGDLLLNTEESIPGSTRGLVLAPTIARPDSYFIISADDGIDAEDDVLSVAYPVCSITDPQADLPPADAASLVLGHPRASVLRILRTPRTVGSIADSLQLSPSTISRHCDHLESAGLITRRRRGQYVEITRTTAGTALLDALSGS